MMNYIWKYKTPEGFDDLVMCGDGASEEPVKDPVCHFAH